MRTYSIRHLPTEWNKRDLLQGKRDIPISKLCRNDMLKIEENAKLLNRTHFDIVITSALIRTQQTAMEYGFSKIHVESLLNELDFGSYEGKSKRNLLERVGHDWVNNPRKIVLGESLVDFECRLKRFLSKYKNYKQILLFGHGAVIRGLVSIKKQGSIDGMNTIDVPHNSISVI